MHAESMVWLEPKPVQNLKLSEIVNWDYLKQHLDYPLQRDGCITIALSGLGRTFDWQEIRRRRHTASGLHVESPREKTSPRH